MAKSFKIQQKPTFKAPVNIPLTGQDPMRVTFTFKAFNRIELAKVLDEWREEGEAMIKEMREDAINDMPWSMEKLTRREMEMQTRQVKSIVDGWGFDDEFTDENIEELVGMAVSITDAIIEQYHEAYSRARKGN